MAANVGDQFTLTLVNDQNSQIIPDEDGALGNPGDTSFSQGQITVTAVNTGTGSNGPNPPFAFAIYRAPVDFARQVSTGLYKSGVCGSITGSDDQLACRSVSLQVQGPSGNPTLVPITVVRPPVILIHGLWGNPSNWDSFSPLYSDSGGADSRFYVGLINYDTPPVVTIVSSVPDYSSLPVGQGLAVLANAHGNALGFQYNAPDVLSKLVRQIQKFKTGANPSGIAVAGVQADIVAHSMGGDISRTLALQTGALSLQANFLDAKTFGQGSIHKLITVDTPHLGSTLATQLLQGQNACVRNKLALAGMASFESVGVITSLGPAAIGLPGAVGDLVDSPLSQALTNISINNSGQRTVRTALIGGAENGANLAGLANTSSLGFVLHTACGTFGSSQLAANLTPTGWPTVFGQDNDAIVGQASQFNNLAPDPGALFASDGNGRGFVHSPGTEQLGFLGPSVLDPGAIPNQVITLLNVPVTSNLVFHDLNP